MTPGVVRGLNNYGSVSWLVALVLGSHPRPGATNDVEVFAFQWAGQLPSVLGVEKVNGIKSQLGGNASLN